MAGLEIWQVCASLVLILPRMSQRTDIVSTQFDSEGTAARGSYNPQRQPRGIRPPSRHPECQGNATEPRYPGRPGRRLSTTLCGICSLITHWTKLQRKRRTVHEDLRTNSPAIGLNKKATNCQAIPGPPGRRRKSFSADC